MYIPKYYLMNDKEEILNFIRQYSFATLITVKDNFQEAVHLPFVVDELNDELILYSHFAKANNQWKNIIDNKVLVIFSGPHAYISPKYYESKMNVPTWNYVSIHVYGNGEIIEDKNESFLVLDKMINSFEKEYNPQWNDLSVDYKEKMLNGIVAFKIKITDIQAKKKLSQNKTDIEQKKIISEFEKSSNFNEVEIANFMKKNFIN